MPSVRTELQLHQLPETNTFGIVHPAKVRTGGNLRENAKTAFNNSVNDGSGSRLADRKSKSHYCTSHRLMGFDDPS